jgi:GntP family gluconate:H+ symporter
MGGKKLAKLVEGSLMSGGMIILITSAGGAFGEMLKVAEVGDAIRNAFGSGQNLAGIKLLLMAFFVASLLKIAQGSTTVSMITTSAMFAGLVTSGQALGMHPVYVAAAIGCGAQCGNWMNDSGFWVFAKMGGLTEVEALKTWTVTVSTMAVVGLIITVIFASIMPLV